MNTRDVVVAEQTNIHRCSPHASNRPVRRGRCILLQSAAGNTPRMSTTLHLRQGCPSCMVCVLQELPGSSRRHRA
jgi:hypothetical protein